MSPLQGVNLLLRVLLEAAVVTALAYWGFHTGSSTVGKIALGSLMPVVGFGFWGAVDFRRAPHAETLRLLQQLAVSGLAACAAYLAGARVFGIALAILSIAHHALVYASGGRLLNTNEPPDASAAASSRRSRRQHRAAHTGSTTRLPSS